MQTDVPEASAMGHSPFISIRPGDSEVYFVSQVCKGQKTHTRFDVNFHEKWGKKHTFGVSQSGLATYEVRSFREWAPVRINLEDKSVQLSTLWAPEGCYTRPPRGPGGVRVGPSP